MKILSNILTVEDLEVNEGFNLIERLKKSRKLLISLSIILVLAFLLVQANFIVFFSILSISSISLAIVRINSMLNGLDVNGDHNDVVDDLERDWN